MSLIAFDTYSFVKRLTASGMPEAQAEILAETQSALLDDKLATKNDIAQLATKADLAEFKATIKTELTEFKAATKADIAQLATKAEFADFKATIKTELTEFKAATKAEIAQLATKAEFAEIKAEINEIKSDLKLLKWMMGILIPAVGAILVKLFLR